MLWKCILNIVDNRWDYYYLKKQLSRIRKGYIRNIFVGSSYGSFGIEPKKEDLNLSLPSQDIYYAIKLATVAMHNKNIKNIYLCAGYYTLFCDLSKSNEYWRIDDVYKPLLKDIHNRSIIGDDDNGSSCRSGFKRMFKSLLTELINFILRVHFIFTISYFNKTVHTRERRKLTMWEDPSCKWKDLSDYERNKAAVRRVTMHEKQFRYNESLNENVMVLKKFYANCKKRNIILHYLQFPFSNEYKQNMSEEYWKQKQNLEKIIRDNCDEYVDFNEICDFEIDDFVDCDHLSDKGAKKLSKII